MARNNRNAPQTRPYQHDTQTRTNNPPVGLGAEGDIAEMPQMEYYYNPHLQPILRFDAYQKTPPPHKYVAF